MTFRYANRKSAQSPADGRSRWQVASLRRDRQDRQGQTTLLGAAAFVGSDVHFIALSSIHDQP